MNEPHELLTSKQVMDSGIVTPLSGNSRRPTTIDATIGEIITKSGVCKEQTVNIPPRGIAWIKSLERFTLPNDVTGISTLRTTWTRKGILTLTVGIVDPGYDGYLGTAVINFSKNEFALTKGDTFLRTAFFKHAPTEGIERSETEDGYLNSVIQDSAAFSETFLTIDTLADEVVPKVFGLPKLAAQIAAAGLILALLALTLPPAMGLVTEFAKKDVELAIVKSDVAELQTEIDALQAQLVQLEANSSTDMPRPTQTLTTEPEQ